MKTRLFIALVLLSIGCSHPGLAGKMADGSLRGCIEWAQAHGDTELLVYCSAADATVPGVLDLFAARQQGIARDAGTDR